MYNTEGVPAIATTTDLRVRPAHLVRMLGKTPVIGIQKNNKPVAVLLSFEAYKNVKSRLEQEGIKLDEMGT